MATLSYTAIASLDGCIEDESGGFGWAVPDPDLHAYVNDLERSVGTHLYGRRMYETMAVWQDVGAPGPGGGPAVGPAGEEGEAVSPEEVDYAEVWRGLDKVVYSTTLEKVWTDRTRLERAFDPEAVRRLKESSDRELSVSGPGLAHHAFAAGLVDDVHLFLHPVSVGGGKAALPRGLRLDLELVGRHEFPSGVVHLHHRTRPS